MTSELFTTRKFFYQHLLQIDHASLCLVLHFFVVVFFLQTMEDFLSFCRLYYYYLFMGHFGKDGAQKACNNKSALSPIIYCCIFLFTHFYSQLPVCSLAIIRYYTRAIFFFNIRSHSLFISFSTCSKTADQFFWRLLPVNGSS